MDFIYSVGDTMEAWKHQLIERKKAPYKKAIKLAEEFIIRAKLAIGDIEDGNTMYSKKNAAAKRCSMELSNALVYIRNPHKK